MKSFPLPRLTLVLGLLGSGAISGVVSAGAALADSQFSGRRVGSWSPNSGPHWGWVQAQRAWADQSNRHTQWRLDQLERCLAGARQRWDQDQCLRRDDQARERQWRRDQEAWQVLMQRQTSAAQLPWRSGLGL